MHKVLPIITQQVKTPFIHIAESLGEELKNNNIKKALLLGTKFTMSESFYKDILQNFKIETIIPNNEEMEIVNSIIFDELCQGKVLEDSKKKYLQIIESYKEAKAVILGCTEIGMLIQEQDCKIKLFDTTKIHIKKAVELALK